MQRALRHKFFLLILLMLIGGAMPAFAAKVEVQTPVNAQPMDELTSYFAKKQLTTDNRLYTYYLYAPEKPWPEGVKFPVVLVMHGTPGFSYAAKYLISGDIAAKYPAFVIVPVLKKQTHWAIAPANPAAKKLPPMFGLTGAVNIIRAVAKEYPIDPARIYAVGCSLGGSGALGAARYYPEIFAGALAISSAWDAPASSSIQRALTDRERGAWCSRKRGAAMRHPALRSSPVETSSLKQR